MHCHPSEYDIMLQDVFSHKYGLIKSVYLLNEFEGENPHIQRATIVDRDLQTVLSHPQFKCKCTEWSLLYICLQ